jgi:hypothetical protein
MMQELAKTQFMSFAIKLPTDWKQPTGKPGEQYPKAFTDSERAAVPPVGKLFQAATNNKYHCDNASTVSDKFEAYINGICSAICSAWSQWQTAATMAGIMVNAVTASGGTMVGPPWIPLILASAPMSTPMEMKYSNAIAQAIGTGWTTYQSTILFPGLPLYPAFAAFPGPMAPPMPGVPVPLMSLTQVPVSVSKEVLKASMIGNLSDPTAPHNVQLFDSVADAFDKCFKIWQGATQVTNVIGFGPIPTFAPPFVPVGPVVMGSATMTPGGLV